MYAAGVGVMTGLVTVIEMEIELALMELVLLLLINMLDTGILMLPIVLVATEMLEELDRMEAVAIEALVVGTLVCAVD